MNAGSNTDALAVAPTGRLNMDDVADPTDPARTACRPTMHLADYECEHGRLERDNTEPCGCWPVENAPELAAALVERVHDFDSTPIGQLALIRRQAIAAGRLPEEP